MRGIALAIIFSSGFIELAIRGKTPETMSASDNCVILVVFVPMLVCIILGW